mmetsp:Transcript_10825/g.33342  ORF Transcript_10825/g.33342 Transcript_10825/m.33342 type:complete len:422 (+) Transcript_10825:92-1357(+)
MWELIPLSEMPANASRYDWTRAMPPPSDRSLMWSGWTAVSALAALASVSIFAGILSSPKARASAFNLYLVALSIPDAIFSVNCAITCGINLAYGFYISVPMCSWQMFYVSFGIAGSFWLNALVAREVHVLLWSTKRLQFYVPPSHRVVVRRCGLVLVFSALVSTWHMWGFLPFRAFPSHGLACVAHEYDTASTFFFWIAYMPAIAFLPCLYAVYIALSCWWHQLLRLEGEEGALAHGFGRSGPLTPRADRSRPPTSPEEGAEQEPCAPPPDPAARLRLLRRNRQARMLGWYFARIFTVVILMWIPAVIFLIAVRFRTAWGVWLGGAWGHLQGLVSALMCLTKPDVLAAVMSLYRCRWRATSEERTEHYQTSSKASIGDRDSFVEHSTELGMASSDDIERPSSPARASARPARTPVIMVVAD